MTTVPLPLTEQQRVAAICRRYKEERLRLKLSQQRVADILNCSTKQVGRYEQSVAMPADKLALLHEANFNTHYILTGISQMQRKATVPGVMDEQPPNSVTAQVVRDAVSNAFKMLSLANKQTDKSLTLADTEARIVLMAELFTQASQQSAINPETLIKIYDVLDKPLNKLDYQRSTLKMEA